ncbi:MAG TPA: formylglycine-generating enzyme family protein [bacterium]|nr:formylglycine-generating enzyme family protein [bacterium]
MKTSMMLLLTLLTVFLYVSCDDGATNDSVDNEPVNDEATVTDNAVDTEQSDDTADMETQDTDTLDPDVMLDELQPEEAIDAVTTDIDTYIVPDDIGAMVEVPAGEFQMGCNESVDTACQTNEYPYHTVMLSAYQIGKYEVTVGEYQNCVDAGACNNNGDYYHIHYYSNADDARCNFGVTGKESHPMTCVTWHGATAYCAYVGQRLPTEAEWEKAARGTDGRKYPWGNEGLSCDYAVISEASAGGDGCGSGGTMPIGSRKAGISPYGAYDMIGNVWEWANDWYGDTYYETSPANDPAGPESGTSHVVRGGSWYTYRDVIYLRTSYRYFYKPHMLSDFAGFRCAK